MNKFISLLVVTLLLAGCGSESPQSADPADPADPAHAEADIRAALSDLGEITEIKATDWNGVYEVVINGNVLYVSADGAHFIAGDLYQSEGRVNLTERQRDDLRRQVLAALEPEDAIVYSPRGEPKHTVWVFTDVDCPYCQRFHAQIAQYNKLGIEVRYLAYPRAGENSPGWELTRSVWCAEDRKAALTKAKNGADLDAPPVCSDAAVEHGYQAGQAVGLRGTPMIIDAQGRSMGGYLSPPQLLQRLNSSG